MEPLFVGGHPAIDFLNTSFFPRGERVETLGDGEAFLEWLIRADLLSESAAASLKRALGVRGLDAVAAEARAIRDWTSNWISRWSPAPDEDYRPELRRLNGLLRKARYHRELVSKKGRWQLIDRRDIESGEDVLALLAMQIGLLVTSEDPTLIKRCAGKECTLWFLDRTKAHRRLFCSATVCGNRAKVAAFRARQRDA
jgi:predicted RNA-binding Zn ribbon-like protein